MSGTVWLGLALLLGVLALELLGGGPWPAEGFKDGALAAPQAAGPSDISGSLLTLPFTRRGDVAPGVEERGYTQDGRYFAGYTNVQRIGVRNDFCRVVTSGPEDQSFFACALAGTDGVSSYLYRTNTVAQGLRLSRDDYMRDISKEGREAYCRILKDRDGLFKPLCLRSTDSGFSGRNELDPNPPEEILTLTDFYANCKAWLRFRDDMVDYVGNLTLQRAGGITLDHTPRPTITRGLQFNGVDQFVRFGDSPDLSLGNKLKMRSMRAFSVWVHFDAFTNNAHIFDFGDGPGLNNTFLGIIGKGEGGDVPAELRPGSACQESTVPPAGTGAQWCPEIRAEELLKTTAAGVDDYTCPGFEIDARRLGPIQTRPVVASGPATRATLLFEIWDEKLRKLQIKVNRAIPLKAWTHIAITAKTSDAMRPDIAVYINGSLMAVKEEGFLPQARVTSNNYLGKSNWANQESSYELRDELFSGAMFDFRMYDAPMSETKIKRTLQWGMGKLGLDNSFASVVG
jgi:hypothetical protein